MKRMSEVFELPVSTGNVLNDADAIYHANGKGEWCATFHTDEQAEASAHAINHVDALADALGDIVFDYFATINLSNVDMAALNPELHKKMTAATEALAAYRGGK